MSQLPSVESSTTELDVFEAFLGSNPDELIAFTETPFAGMLARVNELGFDGEVIQAELLSTGVLDGDAWTNAGGLDLEDFLALTPREYAERYPEQGAPLVAAVLNSIHLSDDQLALHSIAGGTNLSKADKIGIGVAGGLIGANLLVRWASVSKMKRALVENFRTAGPDAEALLARPMDTGFANISLNKDFLGLSSLDITAHSIKNRLMIEWNIGLGGLITKFRGSPPQPEPTPDDFSRASVYSNISQSESVLISEGDNIARDSMLKAVRDDELSPSAQAAMRAIKRAEMDPLRDVDNLYSDLDDFDISGEGLKSIEEFGKSELDLFDRNLTQMAEARVRALGEDAMPDLDGLGARVNQELTNFAYSKEEELDQALKDANKYLMAKESAIQSDIKADVGQIVKNEELDAVAVVDRKAGELDRAITAEVNDAVQSVDDKIAAATQRLEDA